MKNKTRKQLVKEEKYKLIKTAVDDGFYLFEVGEMFKMTEGRVSQIIEKENASGKEDAQKSDYPIKKKPTKKQIDNLVKLIRNE